MKHFLSSCVLLGVLCFSCQKENATSDNVAPLLSPDEESATFQLVPGLKIQLVASEPLVEEPVFITFDEDGRMWVAEMRGFMPDIDGTGETERIGRISILTDEDGDGQMDKRTVFLDSLILPRSIAVVKGGALIAENIPLWYVEDTNGDLIADRKMLVDSTYGGKGLPEHSPNGLWRGIDNGYYNAKSKYRYRFVEGKWIKEETEFRGQWGISHDDAGRLYYNYNWSQLHADIVPPNYLSRNAHHTASSGIDIGVSTHRAVFPIRPNPAVNRGYIPGSLDEKGRLLEFTSASAPLVYRGMTLPEEYRGNVFVCEPAGNLIKRNILEEGQLTLRSHFAYPDKEFLAATDERFRPVFLATGPDGALYVADMYHGIIQHGAYITPYLREQYIQRELDQGIHYGRIWRIAPKKGALPKTEKLSDKSSAELVPFLSYSNGWYRDVAQRLLVEKQDLSIVPEIQKLVVGKNNFLGKLHALWTLEGLGYNKTDIYEQATRDVHPKVRAAAIRILEIISQKDVSAKAVLEKVLVSHSAEPSIEVQLQVSLSAGCLEPEKSLPILLGILDQYVDSALFRDAVMSSLEDSESQMLRQLRSFGEWKSYSPGKSIFLEMLTTAIMRKGAKQEIAELEKIAGNSGVGEQWQREAITRVLALQEKKETPQADSLSANEAIPVERMVAGRQLFLNTCSGCHGSNGEGMKNFAPPLASSEWVTGDKKRLMLLVLHGLEGPLTVGGHLYDKPEILPVMPSFTILDDKELADILTYIRNAWGNIAEPVSPGDVGHTRHTSQGRVVPWTEKDLLHLQPTPESHE
ncbi:MAG: c-type cytochrome [Bacteroidia bacterium]|nr:c-type cytochrome [Bacteroidia bacterium]